MHLYGDVASVPAYLDQARELMRSHGYLKPVVVGEHGGPQPFEFPAAMAVMQQVFTAAFSEPPPAQSTGELAAQAGQDTPERRAMDALYDQMADLPPTLQMFMAGCPADLEARRDRINGRQVVMRPWPGPAAVVTDTFGQTETVRARDGQIELKAGVTPVYVTGPGG